MFQSRPFSAALIAAHLSLLVLFLTTRWLKPSEGRLSLPTLARSLFSPPSPQVQAAVSKRITPRFILTTILSANAIGMLCARSLHFQFFSWIAWATPALLWQAGFHPVLQYALWAFQEYLWNIYPSNDRSSPMVVACLAVTVTVAWYGLGRVDGVSPQPRADKKIEHVQ